MRSTMSAQEQSCDASLLIVVQPLINAVGIAFDEQAMSGDPMGGVPFSDFEQSRTTFSCLRMRMMLCPFLQGQPFALGEPQHQAMPFFDQFTHSFLLHLQHGSFEGV